MYAFCMQALSNVASQMFVPRRSEQACLARQDFGHTHLAHVLECVIVIIIIMQAIGASYWC